jgi:hypothetical protein
MECLVDAPDLGKAPGLATFYFNETSAAAFLFGLMFLFHSMKSILY